MNNSLYILEFLLLETLFIFLNFCYNLLMFKSKKTHINFIKPEKELAEKLNNFEEEKNKEEELLFSKEKEGRVFRFKSFGKYLKYIAQFFLIILILAFVLAGASFLFLKGSYVAAKDGIKNIQAVLIYVKKENFQKAQELSALAQNDFEIAYIGINNFRSNFIVSHIPFINSQLQDVEYLIKTAEILSKSGKQGLLLASEVSKIFNEEDKSFSELEVSKKQKVLQKIYESIPELNGIRANLELAYLNLDQIKANGFLSPWQNKIQELKEGLWQINEVVTKAIPITQMLPVLAGYPEKTAFLVMFQNKDELRPTGGFLGTYGILEIENGEILNFETHDIYHMDMPVKDYLKIEPPEPIKKYLVKNWYMRDSNWSPNWPTSAKKIEWFWQEENKFLKGENQINDFSGEFTGVIAITPDLIHDLLLLVGPVNVEGQEYNAYNFTDLLEYRVEQGYVELGVPKWERKEIISEITKNIKNKIFDLPVEKWQEVIKIFNSNIYKKNILVYLHDEQLQSFGQELGWTGELKKTTGDYFMVVDANLGAAKTDAVMNKKINYQLEKQGEDWIAKIKINYAHQGSPDWRTTTYQTYTRVYVPKGAELIKYEGITDGDIKIGEELGKTFFGGFISIKPGNIGSLYFEYKLPENVKKMIQKGYYVLDVQKQPGNDVSKLTVDLMAPNKVKSYQPTGFFVEKYNNQRLIWNTDLTADRQFKYVY